MAYKYLYIDDNYDTALGLSIGLSKEGELEIIVENPKGDWEEERKIIESVSFREYNGLIIDLNLEETKNKKNLTISRYKGSSLAQEIRNLSKENRIKDIPIVLISADINIVRYFDRTNEDLFDLIISREKLNNKDLFFADVRQKLISLSRGYELITRCKTDMNLLELFKYNLKDEDVRFVEEIKTVIESPTHTISNFIIKNILEKSGILITDKILATRLGIDIDQSNDWQHLIYNLNIFSYNGVFSEGWKRWWMSGLENWWTTELKIKESLRSTKACRKVEILKEKLGITKLTALTKNEKAKSETFWTNCIGSGIAIDTIDGLLVAGQDANYPWQDKNYVSIEEALKPRGKDYWKKLSPTEDFKHQLLKKQYPNERLAR